MVLLPTMWKSALPTASRSPAPRRPSFPTSALPSSQAVLPVLATLNTAGFGLAAPADDAGTHAATAATATSRATSRLIGVGYRIHGPRRAPRQTIRGPRDSLGCTYERAVRESLGAR